MEDGAAAASAPWGAPSSEGGNSCEGERPCAKASPCCARSSAAWTVALVEASMRASVASQSSGAESMGSDGGLHASRGGREGNSET